MTVNQAYCLIDALLRRPVRRTPVWMMRQAGRYLPEYRRVREKAGSFMNLCTNPELACEVTLQPLRRYRFDAAILFSDILTVPDAMGLGLHFVEQDGPHFERPLQSAADVRKLPIPDPEIELRYVMDAVRLIKNGLEGRVPLIGFSGSPWTLATYMVEGGSSRDFQKIKGLMYNDAQTTHVLLDKLAQAVTRYLNAQIAAGADAIMLFDTWGGTLSALDYQTFSLSYARAVYEGLNLNAGGDNPVPAILFTKGGGQWLESMAGSGFSALGLDWTTDLAAARLRVGDRVALQGNLDPMVLHAKPEVIRRKVRFTLDQYGRGSGHVFNLGHGILPDVDPDQVQVMVEAVHEFSPEIQG
ncbi:MAG: uroporphyrinogen decarboxylase [Methylococcaceae bacterium]|nr:uroporphyrinogen decarboxylase [Methylococcaceae bacterium]MCI0732385.1 uroporphyrinogen decarboxylase [Methylococcaceae bacterium]